MYRLLVDMIYRQSHPHYSDLDIDEHLHLVEPKEKHAEASLSWVESPDVIQYMGADFSHPTLEGELQRIREIRENRDEYSWMIELDGHVIGNVCINSIAETTGKFGVKSGNLTVLIGAKDQWKKGIGARVCTAILAWAFSEAGFEAMGARALQENIASIRTLQKLGFEEIGMEPYDGGVSGKPSVWKNFKIGRQNGSENEQIHIVPYDPVWPTKFMTEKKVIEAAVAPWLDGGIHHVGSTAIPGLDAKPIIDVMAGVKNLEAAKACIPLLEAIGYCYAPYRPYMHWFCKPSPAHREFHLQLMEPSHPQWNARLKFRDYLRTHPETAREYADLKKRLAEEFRDDREAYTDAKSTFVESVVKRATDEL